MHIVVTVKPVVDPNTPPALFRIGNDGTTLELGAGISQIMNGCDANAVEAALALKEMHGGSITVLSVGGEPSKSCLRRAIGMGADRGVQIEGPGGLACDSALIAKLLGKAIRKLGPVNLILCGRQASDTDAGQVPLLLAEELKIAAASPIQRIHAVDEQAIVVDRIGDDCTQRLRVQFPAVLGISNELNKPRPAPLKGVMLAKKAEIPCWSQRDLGVEDLKPGLMLRRLFIEQPANKRAEFIVAESEQAAGSALADRLRMEGMI